MRNIFAIFILLAIFLSAPRVLEAQDSAAMTGVVTDATGAVVPGTLVTLTNSLTGAAFTQTTDNKGSYRFANVPPNEGYKVAFTHGGFSTAEVSDLTLNVGITRTQDAILVAGKNETIEVSASNQTVTLDTTDATIGNNLDVKTLNELPVQDRTGGISTLFYLQPGVDSASGAVTGARTDQTEVTLDGLDVDDIAASSLFYVVGQAPIDSVEQFTGTVAGLVPSVGTGSGGQFQLVTKSGTNTFHGNINEYHRDTSTAANTYFNNNVGVARTPLIRNQFGGNIGGPVIIPKVYNGKDKLFFFVDVAASRIIQSSTAEPTVPMTSLTSATPTLNYINNGPGCTRNSRINTQPTCISSLTAAQVAALDPAGMGFNTDVLTFLKGRYPAPNDLNHGDGVNTAGLRFTSPTPNIDTTYVSRIDYNMTPTQKIYGRVTLNRTNLAYSLPEFPGDPDSLQEIDRSYGYVVSHIWTIGQNKVNQFSYGDNISKVNFPTGDFGSAPNVYSFPGLSNPYGTYNAQERRVPIPVVRDDFNWQVGRHGLNMGGDFKFIKTNSNALGDFNFVGAGLQGNSLGGGLNSSGTQPSMRPADILNSTTAKVTDYDELFAASLGLIGDISTNFNYTAAGTAVPAGTGGPRAYRYYETEAYVGDTWKVTKDLTFTYGLRWQFDSVPYEAHGAESISELVGSTPHQSTFNAYFNQRLAQNEAGVTGNSSLPLFQEVLGGKANNAPSSYMPSYKDFAPRVAFAYNPSFMHKTVFNGSAAIVYDRTIINAINFLQDQLSFLFYNNNTNQFGSATPYQSVQTDSRLGANLAYSSSLNPTAPTITTPYIPYVSGGVPFGLAANEEGFVIDPVLKDPYSIALNFGIQQELPGHMVMKVNYVGRLGRRLLADADASQILNFPDIISGQGLSPAFAALTGQIRQNPNATVFPAIPWFENVIPSGVGAANGYANNTSLVASLIGALGSYGDIGDSLATLAGYGLLPPNAGIPAQFGTQAYLTNKGSSNYSALLFTLNRNLAQGLKFDFNYTFAHSIDNNSQSSNNNALYNVTGIICDVTQPRACRGSSDFDVRQEFNSDFTYDLPFGRGKMFLGNDSHWADEAIGGWSLSGIPTYRTGTSVNPLSDAFIASFAAEDPSIFTGNKSDLKAHVNNVKGTVYDFAGGAAGAAQIFNEFRGPLGLEYGQRNLFKGPGFFNLDMGLAKKFPITPGDRVNLNFRADFFNILNHPSFANPGVNQVGNASIFGQISAASSIYRVGQFSLRLDF